MKNNDDIKCTALPYSLGPGQHCCCARHVTMCSATWSTGTPFTPCSSPTYSTILSCPPTAAPRWSISPAPTPWCAAYSVYGTPSFQPEQFSSSPGNFFSFLVTCSALLLLLFLGQEPTYLAFRAAASPLRLLIFVVTTSSGHPTSSPRSRPWYVTNRLRAEYLP